VVKRFDVFVESDGSYFHAALRILEVKGHLGSWVSFAYVRMNLGFASAARLNYSTKKKPNKLKSIRIYDCRNKEVTCVDINVEECAQTRRRVGCKKVSRAESVRKKGETHDIQWPLFGNTQNER
jgi:hypothetical protein